MKPRISVVLATYNEEKNIGECLESVRQLADEVIIVDGSSTDNTREVAREYGARVIKTTNPPIFHINKQKALEAATGDWILQLDADERVSPELAKEIKEVTRMTDEAIRNRKFDAKKKRWFEKHQRLIEERDGKYGKETGEIAAFFVPRLNYFLGRPMRYAGTYPDGVIRLVKKGKAWFPAKSVHEQIHIEGEVAWLENDLIHMGNPTFAKYLTGMNRYTSLTAEELAKQKLPINVFSFIFYMKIKPVLTFFSLYFRHKGFLDGFPGFAWSLFSGLHFPVAYLKYWEKKRNA